MHSRTGVFLGSIFVAGLVSAPSLAQDRGASERAGFELTPYAGLRVSGDLDDDETGDNYSLDDGSTFGLTFGIPWEQNTMLEIWYSHQETDIDYSSVGGSSSSSLDLDNLHLGGTVLFEPRGSTVPFFVFTLGGTRVDSSDPDTKSDTFPSFSIGGGWHFFPEERFGLRLEGRALGILVDSNSSAFCGSNPGGSGCLVRVSGDMLWQFELMAGAVFRF